jgi:hypothetical protein
MITEADLIYYRQRARYARRAAEATEDSDIRKGYLRIAAEYDELLAVALASLNPPENSN